MDRLVVLGASHGSAGASAVRSIVAGNEQVRAATGVDLVAAARGRIGSAE